MSLIDLASLVLAPTATKEGKVYSAIPDTGDGDLSFTRATNGTRVNSAGLIEKVRTNLYTHSGNFANGAWVLIDTVKASTSETDPNGGTTAANITWTAGSGRYFYQSKSTSSISTVSFYVKSNGGGNNFRFFANGATIFSSDLTATSTWTRYSFVFTGNGSVSVGITNATDNSAADLLIAFAQLETGDIATDYIPTTSAAVSVGMTANVPRVDYSGGGCPSLLLEGQRTNLVTFSEQFDNAAWNKTNSTITANNTISPDGYANADKITDNANNTQHRVTQAIAVTSGTSYTASIFVKNDDKGDFAINFTASGFSSTQIVFNLINGTITSGTGTIEDYGNGWYRISATAAANVTGSGTIGFNLGDGGGYVGTGESVFIWGAQIEEGSYATSYIPTLSAASTRVADECSKTGISSLIGQTEGTVFAEVNISKLLGATSRAIIRIGTATNFVRMLYTGTASNTLRALIRQANVTKYEALFPYATTGTLKIAIGYKSADSVFYVNGTQVASIDNLSFTLPTIEDLEMSSSLEDSFSQAILFPTRLTNTELADLTTI